jgi:hypothetical protein
VTWFTVAKARNADDMPREQAKLLRPTPLPAAFHGAKERSGRVQIKGGWGPRERAWDSGHHHPQVKHLDDEGQKGEEGGWIGTA